VSKPIISPTAWRIKASKINRYIPFERDYAMLKYIALRQSPWLDIHVINLHMACVSSVLLTEYESMPFLTPFILIH